MNDKTRVENIDCMIRMRETPDKFYDLAIVDPPYGLSVGTNGENSKEWGVSKSKGFSFRAKKYTAKDWDKNIPEYSYFVELERISKKQIIWGGNNFGLPLNNYCVWYKMGLSNNDKYSDTELAYISFKCVPKLIDIWWNGFGSINSGEERFHPTQKPVALYKWLLKNYAKEGDKILDTHLGSQSSRIAAFDLGFDFTGYELDKDYFEAGCKRFEQHRSQLKLFPIS